MVFPLSDYAEIANHISALGTLPFNDTCMFGLLGADDVGGASVLGDTFLRSAYLLYDLDNNSIGIAQTVFNSTRSNVVEFAAGQSGFPVVSGVSSSSTSSATGSSAGSGGTTSKPTGTGTGAAKSSTSKAAAGLSSPPPFDGRGLFVLSVVGLCSLVGLGWFLG